MSWPIRCECNTMLGKFEAPLMEAWRQTASDSQCAFRDINQLPAFALAGVKRVCCQRTIRMTIEMSKWYCAYALYDVNNSPSFETGESRVCLESTINGRAQSVERVL